MEVEQEGEVIDVTAYTTSVFRLLETFVEPSGQVQFLYSIKSRPSAHAVFQIGVANTELSRMTYLGASKPERPVDFPRRYNGAFEEASGLLALGADLEVARAACKRHGKILGAVH